MDLPRGYEPFKINTVANDAVAGILCRRPDGGVSDFRVVLPNPTTYGVCPSCGRDMKKHNASTFSCSAGHVLVVMTSGEAPTRRTAQRSSAAPSGTSASRAHSRPCPRRAPLRRARA